jgi:deoxyribose-phosphate aldolase
MTSIAGIIDHTLLKPEATALDVTSLIAEGVALGVYSVCVSPSMLPLAIPAGSDLKVAVVCGFPSGKHTSLVKATEAREAVPAPAVLKVIIESAALDDDQIVAVCQAAVAAGADFVKTSTGFHPAGGATVDAVRLMSQTVNGAAGVKASGGIRSYATAQAMIDAGATRLGVSGSKQVLAEEAGAAEAATEAGAY